MPKGYSEPLIMQKLLKRPMSVSELERITKIKRPTIYLSIYRLQKKKLAKPDSRKRNKKWMLTENGRNIAMRRVRGEKLLEKVLPQLREALRRGIKLREVLRALTS
ncbi:MAG: hypothetical protein RMJ06_01430 [Nitrososphaerota archaeon]|nr:hypothetical protein [Nitrososphaerota archaeon]